MDVSVVITCWNCRKLLERNLPSVLKAAANPQNKIREIIVVDDFSSDNSVAFLEENLPQIKVVKHSKNMGYSAVCNTGVSIAEGDLVVILNADVVPSETFLKNASEHFKDESVFAVTFNEGKFGPGKAVWKNGFLEIVSTDLSQGVVFSSWANGGSSVFNKKIWLKLGGMSRLFLPFYYEDIDLGITALKAGHKCLWDFEAKVIHEHESTINVKNFAKHKKKINIDLIKQRNHLLLTWKLIDSRDLFFSHCCGLVKRCTSSPGYLKIVLSALQKLPLLLRLKNNRQDKLSTETVLNN